MSDSWTYPDLADYLSITELLLGIDATHLARSERIGLAISALDAPKAGWGTSDLYPDVGSKAAILLCRLISNHPLPDGNKRCAHATFELFLALNGYKWQRVHDEAEDQEWMFEFLLEIAAGRLAEDAVIDVLRDRIKPI